MSSARHCAKPGCLTVVSARATYCSDKCRMAVTRTKLPEQTTRTDSNPNKSPQPEQPEQPVDSQGVDCLHVQQSRNKNINTGPWLPASQLPHNTVNRVSLPGDADYKGVAVI